MTRYDVQKKAQLDRLTLMAQLEMRRVMREHAAGEVRRMYSALESLGAKYKPSHAGLEKPMKEVFDQHERNTVWSAVSDGIKEVSPEGKLAGWAQFPEEMPVEATLLGKTEKKQRETIFEKLFGKTKKENRAEKLLLITKHKDTYLKYLSTAYEHLAKSWLDGDGTVEDVKQAIAQVLRKTDSHAEMIFRTETTKHFNNVRSDYFAEHTDVDYLEFYAVHDGRVSEICKTRDGFVFPISEKDNKNFRPPCHVNCRSTQRPLMSVLSSQKAVIDKGLGKKWGGPRSESDFAPLPKGWR